MTRPFQNICAKCERHVHYCVCDIPKRARLVGVVSAKCGACGTEFKGNDLETMRWLEVHRAYCHFKKEYERWRIAKPTTKSKLRLKCG
jgi:hypothetical protein